jgi:septum formation protein
MYPFLYLASQSPRRAELLTQLGVHFELLLPGPNEDSESLEVQLLDEPALEYVERVTLAKLGAAIDRLKSNRAPWAPILCADTTVAVEISGSEIILGKPESPEHALEMLEILSGLTHQVHTAVALCSEPDKNPLVAVSSSTVEFALCSEDLLRAYVNTGEPMGKAGAYGIQGLGSALIQKIEGSYSGIMGLPLYETSVLLDAANIEYALSL